jgi:hypothetical protein
MKNEIAIFGILVLFMSACNVNSPQKQNVQVYDFKEINQDSIKEMTEIESITVNIEVPDNFETLNLDKSIKEMNYLRLETNSNSIIGRIDKLEIHEDRIYILDKTFAQAIYTFDISGHHLYTINKKGYGPEEYVQIMDFCFLSDTLVVYDGLGAKLLFFNEMGNFLSKSKTGFHFRNFKSFSNGDYLIVTKNAPNSFLNEINNYSVLIGKPDNIVKYKGFKNNLFLEQFEKTNNNPIVEYDRNSLISPLLSNFIYQFNSDGSYFPKYKISFKNELPPDYYEQTSVQKFEDYVKNRNFSYFMGTFFENDEHLFFRFNPPGNFYGYVIFNKNNSNIICYDGTNSPENKFWGLNTPHYVYNNYFVGSIDPIDIVKKKNKLLQNQLISSDKREILQSISESDNPILIFYLFN